MTREQLKEAVVEAARTWARVPKNDQEELDRAIALRQAVRALDAHTEAEAQEVVTLAVWEDKDGGVTFMRAGRLDDRTSQDAWRDGFLNATRLGTVTLPLKREGGQ